MILRNIVLWIVKKYIYSKKFFIDLLVLTDPLRVKTNSNTD